MKYFYQILLVISCLSCIHTQKFEEESPYMLIRLMDLKTHEWKPSMLDDLEKVLDAELKYTDLKKGTECRKIDFEQEAGYPKQDGRFLDLSVRGLCTDEKGVVHNINKELLIVAIERKLAESNDAVDANIFKVGHVQLFRRDRNLLNFIIIPVSVTLTLLLVVITFVLRRLRYAQKKRHIITKLEEKRQASDKKAQTIANIDPNANEKQHLLQLDPTVVGSASDTLGSPKEFTKDQYSSPSRNNNQDYPIGPSVTSKDNRAPYYNRDDETAFQNQRSTKSSRERMHVPYENQPRFPTGQSSQGFEYPDMIPMQEQQPRVCIRTVRGDENQQPYYQNDNPTTSFVPIPVQVERSSSHPRYTSPPYHSDPHYQQGNV